MLYERFSTGADGVSTVGSRVLKGVMQPETAAHPHPKTPNRPRTNNRDLMPLPRENQKTPPGCAAWINSITFDYIAHSRM